MDEAMVLVNVVSVHWKRLNTDNNEVVFFFKKNIVYFES
jgi:hypothetical protein